MSNPWFKALLCAFAIPTASAAPYQKPGDLIVTPTRLLLDDKSRSGDVTLVNRGASPIRYRLSLVDMAMDERGALRRIPSSENSAASMLRLSPREIVLEPGASQRIKILVTFPSGMPEREIRSHLAFEPISTPTKQHLQPLVDTTSLRINFEVRSVITIPVIARHGTLSAVANIDQIRLNDQTLNFRLSRTGSRTVRGDLNVVFKPDKGVSVNLARIAGLPVYFPNTSRQVSVRLERDVRTLGKGSIEVVFTEPRSKGAISVRAVLPLTG